MSRKEYRNLGDLTYQQRVVLAALEHSSRDDQIKYNISLGRTGITLNQIVDVEGRGTVVSENVKVTINRMYCPKDVINDLEKLIYKPRECQCSECKDFGG